MTTIEAHVSTLPLVQEACLVVGLDHSRAQPVRIADNAIWDVDGSVIVRITRPGRADAAYKELATARWLADCGVPAVRPAVTDTPVLLPDDRAATFWQRLPAHTAGRVEDIGALLRQLHAQGPPSHLPLLTDPTSKVRDRLQDIEQSGVLEPDDSAWLISYAQGLAGAWQQLPTGLSHCPVHGDAWSGNVARSHDGHTFLLDLDSAAIGPPEWDLTSTALKTTTTGTISPTQYQRFVTAYGGYDVTDYPGYEIMCGIRELRMTTYSVQTAVDHPHAIGEARHRVACLRGKNGPRPWSWTAVPHPPGKPSPVV